MKKRQPPWVNRPKRLATETMLRVPCEGWLGESIDFEVKPRGGFTITLRNKGYYLSGDVSAKDAKAISGFIEQSRRAA